MSKEKKSRVVVTGMGFALPGENDKLCTTKDEFWNIISTGKRCIEKDGIVYGFIRETDEQLKQRIDIIPKKYMKNYAQIHLIGLISLMEACKDAGLELNEGKFKNAAVLTARQSIDPCSKNYNEFISADPETITPTESRGLFTRMMLSSLMTDVVTVQAALLQSGGPMFSISCGCASSGVLIGLARKMIEDNEVDMVVITGADTVEEEVVTHYEKLCNIAEQTGHKASFSAPPTKLLLDQFMKPYDKNSCGFNAGIGSATIILESEAHAKQRGAHIYGEVLGQATVRSTGDSALTIDESGGSLIEAVKKCLNHDVSIEDIDYINGGAQGDKVFNIIEANAVDKLFGLRGENLPVTSQEGCFGHNASALGVIGVAATLLMMEHNLVCPTAGCQEKDDICSFNPVPGIHPLPHRFDYALSFNYQAGGVCSSLLLGRYDAHEC